MIVIYVFKKLIFWGRKGGRNINILNNSIGGWGEK